MKTNKVNISCWSDVKYETDMEAIVIKKLARKKSLFFQKLKKLLCTVFCWQALMNCTTADTTEVRSGNPKNTIVVAKLT